MSKSSDTPVASVLCATMLKGSWRNSIESVLQQVGITFELVLVVDAGTGENAEITELSQQYGNLIVIYNETNIGLTRSLVKAANHASGTIYVRHDDDDISEPGRLQELTEKLLSSDIDVLGSYALAKNEGDDRTWLISSPTTDADIKKTMLRRNCLMHSTIALKKEAYDKTGGYNVYFRFAQDYELYLRLIRSGATFGCIPEELVTRTIGGDSITVSKRKIQMLYSFAALILHNAEMSTPNRVPMVLLNFLKMFMAPNWLRKMRRMYRARR